MFVESHRWGSLGVVIGYLEVVCVGFLEECILHAVRAAPRGASLHTRPWPGAVPRGTPELTGAGPGGRLRGATQPRVPWHALSLYGQALLTHQSADPDRP